MTETTPGGEARGGRPQRSVRLVLGWVVGVIVGVAANYAISGLFGPSYPVVPTTFVAIVACAFLAMWVTERLGPRSTPWIAAVAAFVLAVAAIFFVGPWLTAS